MFAALHPIVKGLVFIGSIYLSFVILHYFNKITNKFFLKKIAKMLDITI